MTVTIFLSVLLGFMAFGMPIAFACCSRPLA